MLAIFFTAAFSSDTDRRLDPFQFNFCVWNLKGFDAASTAKTNKDDEASKVIYNHLSTCDFIVLPGVSNKNDTDAIKSNIEKQNMDGFEVLPSENPVDMTTFSRLTMNNLTRLPDTISYPIANSQCHSENQGTFSLAGSFYGEVEFHDTVNTTRLISVNFPDTDGLDGCAMREAAATEICKIVKETDSSYDIFVGGTFGRENSTYEVYKSVLQACGLEAGSHRNKKAKSNANNTLIEDVYVKGTAKKWEDIFEVVTLTDATFEGQNPITYPVALYVHQPLSSRWFKFEVSYSVCIMAVAIGFFTWLMFFSRIKKDEEGDYEKLPGK